MPVTVHHDKHQEAHEFLKNHKVGVLATTDPNGEPYAAAIYFTVDSALNVSFLTRADTKKADNLQHNKHAMLVVYDAPSQTTVQIAGSVSELTDMVETNKVLTDVIYASIDTTGQDMPPIAKLDLGEYVAYRLKPNQVRMAVFSSPKTGGYHELFKTIVPGHK